METDETNDDFENIIESLLDNENVIFKSQQRNESELSKEDKRLIATDLFNRSKSGFLARYGKHFNMADLQFFKQFQNRTDEADEITLLLSTYERQHSEASKCLKNRRFVALNELIGKRSYFSEMEMMKRNPLLYEQLVGKYLSAEEKRTRDSQVGDNSFVSILLEGIERDRAQNKRKQQEEDEDLSGRKLSDSESDASEDEAISSRSLWGEYQQTKPIRKKRKSASELNVTADERKILKDEFISLMYQNFLDGKDDDFDYNTVDNNEEYDNLELQTRDEEEKYFDAEEPEEVAEIDASVIADDRKTPLSDSEDELDIYMSALNNHPAVVQLSYDMQKL